MSKIEGALFYTDKPIDMEVVEILGQMKNNVFLVEKPTISGDTIDETELGLMLVALSGEEDVFESRKRDMEEMKKVQIPPMFVVADFEEGYFEYYPIEAIRLMRTQEIEGSESVLYIIGLYLRFNKSWLDESMDDL